MLEKIVRVFEKLPCKLHLHNYIGCWDGSYAFYICLGCGKIPETEKDTESATKQHIRQVNSNLGYMADIDFFRVFIPHAIKKSIITEKDYLEISNSKCAIETYKQIIENKS